MQLDIEKYRPIVDHFDMSEESKIELIRTVSEMMRTFVDLAFGETPEQQLLGIDWEKDELWSPDELSLDNPATLEFNHAADGDAEKERFDD